MSNSGAVTMSAANAPATTPSLDAERRAHEPSMEEILASIRRIISDDDGQPLSRRERLDRLRVEPAPPAVHPVAPPQEHAAADVAASAPAQPAVDWRREPVLEAVAAAVAPLAAPVEDEDEAEADDVEDTEDAEDDYGYDESYDDAGSVEAVGALEAVAEDEPAPLVSSDAAAAVAAQFQTLAASMLISESGMLQSYAQEMLRPMLKQWLDDNLPVIVEKLVRAEIERVARGVRR